MPGFDPRIHRPPVKDFIENDGFARSSPATTKASKKIRAARWLIRATLASVIARSEATKQSIRSFRVGNGLLRWRSQ
jgi:hypothetical protein